MSLISTTRVSVELGGHPALHHVDLSVEPGEIVTVIGPNGSGKSTLMKVLVGALPVSSGRVDRQKGLRIGYMPQKLQLDRVMPMTVGRFLCLPKRQPDAELAEALERVGASGLLDKQMVRLSGGQFQRVLLARALLGRPDLLVLDEPTQGLDQPGIAAFYQLIDDLRRDLGCAVLMVSHELHVVMRASDRVICLNGHVCCEGTPSTVSLDPQYRALFGDAAGTLAVYRHDHDHSHDDPDHQHVREGA